MAAAHATTKDHRDPLGLTRIVKFDERHRKNPDELVSREWLVTNGLGGYAGGTLAGLITRRYHGLLIAALPAPLGRLVMMSQLGERVRLANGTVHWLSGEERQGGPLFLDGANRLTEFRLEAGLPVWLYEVDGVKLEKRLFLPRFQNTVVVTYRILRGDGAIRLGLRPLLNARPHEAPVDHPLPTSPCLVAKNNHIEVQFSSDVPSLRLSARGVPAAFTLETMTVKHIHYRLEHSRGYQASGDSWSPGYFRADLHEGESLSLVASTETMEMMNALSPEEGLLSELERRRRLLLAADPVLADHATSELVLAADQFVIAPAGRVEDAARAHAAGDEARTVIAGYHWFTDWGRDTMISLEGLTLTTGRHQEARDILRTFAYYFRDGLIPNLFPEGNKEGLYHTADATMWFFHAVHRYLATTGDWATVELLVPKLNDSIEHHIAGTKFNIGVDPADGLLRQGMEGYALSWMDAKCDGWVVTPRRGKPVEINGLWYNALRLLADWQERLDETRRAAELRDLAARAQASFNSRFWYEQGGHLYDIVDGEHGDDPACRPNQILSFSLEYPVLDPARWAPVFDAVQSRLLTPVGLRSLDPSHPDYKAKYYGDLRTRDAAYHQGTVWAWLIGPFIDAWMKMHPDKPAQGRKFLHGFLPHLDDACIGQISEIFDAEPPFTPRGCVAQAWSVAEALRCWVKTATAKEAERAATHLAAHGASVPGLPD
jgi:predicted glycogen debranching enzyme